MIKADYPMVNIFWYSARPLHKCAKDHDFNMKQHDLVLATLALNALPGPVSADVDLVITPLRKGGQLKIFDARSWMNRKCHLPKTLV